MGKALFLFANIAFVFGFALIANELGVAGQTIDVPTGFVAPEGGSFLDKIIAPFVWAFDAAGSFFQIVGISFTGVSPLVWTIVFAPLAMIDIFIIYGMVRGGGTS